MKKISIAAILALILALCANVAFAKLGQSVISDAKQALVLMSYGEYKKALKKLDFSSKTPSASWLGDFVDENMPQILSLDVQTDVAVAYYDGEYWRICIPVEEPSYDSVTTLVLSSKNGSKITGISAKMWYEAKDGAADAENVVWQDEYDEGDIYIVADDK